MKRKPRRIDLANKTFHRLTVLKFSHIDQKGFAWWQCQCSCGKIIDAKGVNLRNGSKQSCGCLRQAKDFTGKRFGRLTVKKKVGRDIYRSSIWECLCDCGNICTVRHQSLKSGVTQSCGCLRLQRLAEARKPRHGYPATTYKIFYAYRQKAKSRKLDFQLKIDEFVNLCTQDCFYCGRSPANQSKSEYGREDFIYSGIDRVDNSKGYSKDNCVPCCHDCNWAKKDMSLGEYIDFVTQSYKHLESLLAPSATQGVMIQNA